MSETQTARQIFEDLRALKDGPEKKFKLVKVFGALLRRNGITETRPMSCETLVAQIEKLI